jgi:hypothetical protein
MKRILLALGALCFLAAGADAQVNQGSLGIGPNITSSSADVTAATATATLAAPANGYWIVTGLMVTGNQATAAASVVCTVTGLMLGTITVDIPTTVIATPMPPVVVSFPNGWAANPATAVVFSCPTMGAGNLHAAVAISGIIIH